MKLKKEQNHHEKLGFKLQQRGSGIFENIDHRLYGVLRMPKFLNASPRINPISSCDPVLD